MVVEVFVGGDQGQLKRLGARRKQSALLHLCGVAVIADPDKEAVRKRRLELTDRARADLGLCAKPAIRPTDERKTALRSPAQVVHGQAELASWLGALLSSCVRFP